MILALQLLLRQHQQTIHSYRHLPGMTWKERCVRIRSQILPRGIPSLPWRLPNWACRVPSRAVDHVRHWYSISYRKSMYGTMRLPITRSPTLPYTRVPIIRSMPLPIGFMNMNYCHRRPPPPHRGPLHSYDGNHRQNIIIIIIIIKNNNNTIGNTSFGHFKGNTTIRWSGYRRDSVTVPTIRVSSRPYGIPPVDSYRPTTKSNTGWNKIIIHILMIWILRQTRKRRRRRWIPYVNIMRGTLQISPWVKQNASKHSFEIWLNGTFIAHPVR